MLKKLFLFLTVALFFCVPLTPVVAQNTNTGGVVRLVNPIGGKDDGTAAGAKGIVDGNKILGTAVKVALGLLGSITLLVFFYGGFMWLTSAGNSDKVSKGTKSMLYAVIGLFIIFGAYGILNTVISGIRGNATTQGTPDTNTIPFGPENDPSLACIGLQQQACITNQACGWATFKTPGTAEVDTECTAKNKKPQVCREYSDACKSKAQGTAQQMDAFITECENQRQACEL